MSNHVRESTSPVAPAFTALANVFSDEKVSEELENSGAALLNWSTAALVAESNVPVTSP
jgi:hypothetical protein